MKLEKKSFQQLKKQADKVFSLFIRNKYAKDGKVKCFTCDKIFLVKEIQNGHYISRTYLNLRWSELNCKPQCVSCNIFKRGNLDEFALRLEKEERGTLEKLNFWKHHQSTPLKRLDLIEIIKKYK